MIRRLLHYALAAITASAALVAPAAPAQASTPLTDCTEAALDSALAVGGAISFNCGGHHAPATIAFSTNKTILTNTSLDGLNGGHPVVLDGGGSTRLFSVATGVALTLTHVVLTGGVGNGGGCLLVNGALLLNDVEVTQCQANGLAGQGGAIYVAGTGSAVLANATVDHNQAGVAGGGLYSLGTLTITASTLAHNAAGTSDGGGVWAVGPTRVDGSTFYSNTASNGWGGGLYNQGTLSMTNSVLDSNFSGKGGGGLQAYTAGTALQAVTIIRNSAAGAAMYPAGGGLSIVGGVLTLTRGLISNNSEAYSGAGLAILFNGPADPGRATLTGVTLSGNAYYSGEGGGLYNEGEITVTDATFSGDSAQTGGGIYNDVLGQLTLANATLSGNSAGNKGGGIYNEGALTLTNVTLSANLEPYVGGGALANYGGHASLVNVTLAANSAATGGSLLQFSQWPLNVQNSILDTDPASTNCDATGSTAPIVSGGYNLSSDGTCTAFLNHGGDLNNTYPYLGQLANNGGPTLTHYPEPPSLAIDAIPNGVNGCGTTLIADQRHGPRPIHSWCDIGAVEFGWSYPQLWLALIRR